MTRIGSVRAATTVVLGIAMSVVLSASNAFAAGGGTWVSLAPVPAVGQGVEGMAVSTCSVNEKRRQAWNGSPFNVHSRAPILATNRKIHKEALKLLNRSV